MGKYQRRLAQLILAALVLVMCASVIYACDFGDVLGQDRMINCCYDGYRVGFVSAVTNDPPGRIDPGLDKDAGSCTVRLVDDDSDCLSERVIVTIDNAYPYYGPEVTATIKNCGLLPVRIRCIEVTAPAALAVSEPDLVGLVLFPGQRTDMKFTVRLKQEARQRYTYNFAIKETVSAPIYGDTRFWKLLLCSFKMFGQQQIESWLSEIDRESCWLGPTKVADMKALMDKALSGPAKEKFLANYMAMRLNMKSRILHPASTHNVSRYDRKNYLGLTKPTCVSLTDLAQAIEKKCGTDPTKAQYEIMETICNRINGLQI